MVLEISRRSLLSFKLFLVISAFALSFNVTANEADELAQPDLDNITGSTLYLQSATDIYDAPVLDTRVEIAVSGIVSKVKLVQSFANTSNEWVEGHYVFPLPDQAGVNALIVRIGERTIVGTIREKKQAEKQYQAAKEAGQVASLVKQHRPNLFSSRFANIPPGESISIELEYIQTIRYDSDRYSLRVPLTLTPRYSNDLVSDVQDITPNQVTLNDAKKYSDMNHGVEIVTTFFGLNEAAEVSSPSHQYSTDQTQNGTRLTVNEHAVLDRDFILEWYEPVESVPAVRMWRENIDGEDYMLATIMPPTDDAPIPEQPRELVLIIDTSGSMAGTSMEAAKAALMDALSGLKPNDSFNVIEFNDDYRALFIHPQQATVENLSIANRFTRGLQAGGGTQMLGALQTALRYHDTGLLRQVVFITDGSVGYEESVLESVKADLGNSRLFTVGIGTAPNQWFMRKVAEAGRGTFQFIQDFGMVRTEMSRLLRKLESPVLTNISVSFDGGQSEVLPNPIPDLYAKEPIVIAAKLGTDTHTMNVSGTLGQNEWSTSVTTDGAPVSNTGLSTVWARQKIESLQDKQRFHSDPDFYRSLILRIALDHQLLSPYTAFLAVEEQPIRTQAESLVSKKIPNLLPAGSEMQSFSYPQGSAGSDTLRWLSVIMFLIALTTANFSKIRRVAWL